MSKQPFDSFLNLGGGGPSTPRGRGRGGGRGGRGGGGRGGIPVAKRSYQADYSNVGFDYDAINKQGYRKMEGFSVDPFGAPAGATPDSASRGRGRGRGKGNFTPRNNNFSPHQTPRFGGDETPSKGDVPSSSGPDTPSGARTPVTGLGIPRPAVGGLLRGAIGSGRGKAPIRAMQPRQTRDGQVLWGGRGAPLFVKAGELFKDGEVDTVHSEALEQPVKSVDHHLTPSGRHTQKIVESTSHEAVNVEATPLADTLPAALDDNEAISEAIRDVERETGQTGAGYPEKRDDAAHEGSTIHGTRQAEDAKAPSDASKITGIVDQAVDPSMEDTMVEAETIAVSTTTPEEVPENASASSEQKSAQTQAASPMSAEQIDMDAVMSEPSAAMAADSPITRETIEDPADEPGSPQDQATAEEALFFIDTEPTAAGGTESSISYTTASHVPLGTAQSDSEEEQVVFKPRTFRQPEPLEIRLPGQSATSSSRPALIPARSSGIIEMPPELSQGVIKPKVDRKAKKAAKREKRKMRGTGKKAARRSGFDAMDGSDIEWGSDGLPAGLEDELVNLDEMAEDADEDMAVLKDYLAGTMLGAASDTESEEDVGEGVEEGVAAPGLGSKASKDLRKGRKKMRQRGWDDAPDDILDIDEDSSELGDLQAIMDALDSDEEDDDEEEDGADMEEERLFTGKQAWTSEDEDTWFVRSMEEALAGKKPGKGKTTHTALFGSIQNGYDDLDLPTLPKLKGKKKMEGVPEELQAQWEADRQKKAAKKEQRQMDRMIADLAIAAKPSSSNGKRKAKAKNTIRAQQASLAHLIPASAAEVADMFDISSDEAEIAAMGMGIGRGGGRKGKGKAMFQYAELAAGGFEVPNSINTGVGIAGLVEQVRVFVDDPHKTTHTLPPMDKEGRRRMHMLAECFDMKSKSRGSGKARFTVMIKTSRTGLDIDENAISRLLSASQYTGGHFYKAYYTNGKANKFTSGASGKKGGAADRGTSTRAKDGELVGGGADRIGQDNVGHKLLSMMGWAEGGRIGRTQGGLEQPIVAVVKNTKSGLGA